MKAIENMTIGEIENEIKERIHNFKDDESFAFVSYSKKDKEIVYPIVLGWLRAGYNVYIDKDFSNQGSEENWAIQMKEKIQNTDCVIATVFMSENYCYSHATLTELLTMRSDNTRDERASASQIVLPIDVIKLPNQLNNNEFGLRPEIKEEYKKDFAKRYGEKPNKDFWEDNAKCKELFEEGISSLSKKLESKGVSVSYDKLNKKFKSGYTNFYREIAWIMSEWFRCYDLNGNKKSVDDLSGVISRFDGLKVHKQGNVTLVKASEVVEDNLETVEVQKADLSETLVEKEDLKKRKASTTGDVKYYLYGEEFIGNQSDVMIMTFGKVLKKHPEFIDQALESFTCLSNIDYSERKNQVDMPSYFRVCHTFMIDGKTVCIGTAYGMPDKLKLMAKLLMLVGDEKDALQIEGLELPEVKQRSVGRSADNCKGNSSSEEYYISGNRKESNQANMLWDVFEALANKYPEKVSELETMSNVSLAKDVTKPGTKESNPTCFMSYKSFMVNGNEYLVGAAYNRAEKIKRINKMLNICGAPNDFFVLKGEEIKETSVTRTKKEYDL